MPLGNVSNEDFEAEVNNSAGQPLIPTRLIKDAEFPLNESVPQEPEIVTSDVIIKRMGAGRQVGDVNVPQSVRTLLADTTVFEGRREGNQLADVFGVSHGSVGVYATPNSKLAENLSPDIRQDINSFLTGKKEKISKKAIARLSMAMNHITEEKLQDLGAVALGTVAKDMAAVVKSMEPKEESKQDNNVQFLMYAPQVKNENHYQTVTAKDNY